MKFLRFLPHLLGLSASIWVLSCQDPTTGTSDENETSMAKLYRADGAPAARAKLKFYPVSDTSQVPAALTYTTETGEIVLPELPAGLYNAIASDGSGEAALIDSIVYSVSGKASILSDTLKPMGVVRGRVVVQPQHSPQIAWIQVAGMGVAANVDSLGRFEISLPAGRATIYALTREPHYTSTFQSVTAGAGATQDLGDIRLIFTGIPAVGGLTADYDSLAGIVTVRWNRSRSRGIRGYRLEIGGDFVKRSVIFLGSENDTVFQDTVFDLSDPKAVKAGFPTLDLVMLPRNREYSVRAVDSAADTGAAWNLQKLSAKSPLGIAKMRTVRHGLADRPEGCVDLDTLAGGLVCSGIRAYPGRFDDGSKLMDSFEVWTSPDGQSWSAKLPIPGKASNVVGWKGLVWVVRPWEAPADKKVAEVGQVSGGSTLLGAVVEAWTTSGEMVRRDSIADSLQERAPCVLVSGDTLVLQAGVKRVLVEANGPWERDDVRGWVTVRVEAGDGLMQHRFSTLDEPLAYLMDPSRMDWKPRMDWKGLAVSFYGFRWFAWRDGERLPWMFEVTSSDRALFRYRGRALREPILMIWKNCALLPGENRALSMLCPDP